MQAPFSRLKSGIFLTWIRSFFQALLSSPPYPKERAGGHLYWRQRDRTSGEQHFKALHFWLLLLSTVSLFSSLFLLRCPLPVILPQRSLSAPRALGARVCAHTLTLTGQAKGWSMGPSAVGASFHRMTHPPCPADSAAHLL